MHCDKRMRSWHRCSSRILAPWSCGATVPVAQECRRDTCTTKGLPGLIVKFHKSASTKREGLPRGGEMLACGSGSSAISPATLRGVGLPREWSCLSLVCIAHVWLGFLAKHERALTQSSSLAAMRMTRITVTRFSIPGTVGGIPRAGDKWAINCWPREMRRWRITNTLTSLYGSFVARYPDRPMLLVLAIAMMDCTKSLTIGKRGDGLAS